MQHFRISEFQNSGPPDPLCTRSKIRWYARALYSFLQVLQKFCKFCKILQLVFCKFFTTFASSLQILQFFAEFCKVSMKIEEGRFCKILTNFYGFSEFCRTSGILMTDCNTPVNGAKECRKFAEVLENLPKI